MSCNSLVPKATKIPILRNATQQTSKRNQMCSCQIPYAIPHQHSTSIKHIIPTALHLTPYNETLTLQLISPLHWQRPKICLCYQQHGNGSQQRRMSSNRPDPDRKDPFMGDRWPGWGRSYAYLDRVSYDGEEKNVVYRGIINNWFLALFGAVLGGSELVNCYWIIKWWEFSSFECKDY